MGCWEVRVGGVYVVSGPDGLGPPVPVPGGGGLEVGGGVFVEIVVSGGMVIVLVPSWISVMVMVWHLPH